MIASLTGVLKHKSPASIIVDVQGVGYDVQISLPTFYQLPALNESIHLWTHTHVREDALRLYGFSTIEEKSVYLMLLSVSGVGARLAMNILSGLPFTELVAAVKKGDVTKLGSIPGIGQKTAARLVLELKEKMKAITSEDSMEASSAKPMDSHAVEDTVSALVNLGYKPPLAKDAVRKALKTGNGAAGGEGVPIEALIKESLKFLSRP